MVFEEDLTLKLVWKANLACFAFSFFSIFLDSTNTSSNVALAESMALVLSWSSANLSVSSELISAAFSTSFSSVFLIALVLSWSSAGLSVLSALISAAFSLSLEVTSLSSVFLFFLLPAMKWRNTKKKDVSINQFWKLIHFSYNQTTVLLILLHLSILENLIFKATKSQVYEMVAKTQYIFFSARKNMKRWLL